MTNLRPVAANFMLVGIALILLSSCRTGRPYGDQVYSRELGYRTMKSDACSAPAECVANAIRAAKRDCKLQGNNYVYRTVSYLEDGVRYRCEVKTVAAEAGPAAPLDPPEPLGRCSATEVAERQSAGMSQSAIERACAP